MNSWLIGTAESIRLTVWDLPTTLSSGQMCVIDLTIYA